MQYKNKFPTFTEFVLWQFYTGLLSCPHSLLEPLFKMMGIWCHFNLSNDVPATGFCVGLWSNQKCRRACMWRALSIDNIYLLLLFTFPFSVNFPTVGCYPSFLGSSWIGDCWFHTIQFHHFDCLSQFCTYILESLLFACLHCLFFFPLPVDPHKMYW